MPSNDQKLMEDLLNAVILQNRMYINIPSMQKLIDSKVHNIPSLGYIELSKEGASIDPKNVDSVRKDFAKVLDFLKEAYEPQMRRDMTIHMIKQELQSNMLEFNQAGITLPEWIVKINLPQKKVDEMDVGERILLGCAIYSDVIQQLISDAKTKIPAKKFMEINKGFFEKNEGLPEISVSPNGLVVCENPRIAVNEESLTNLMNKYSHLLVEYLDLLDAELGAEKAMSLIKECYETLSSKYPGLSELGVTKSLFRGVFWARVPTGVPGLDELTEGGFPKNSAIILQGPIGSEKSMFGTQFIAEALLDENSSLVVLNNTSVDEFRGFLSRFNIDALQYEKKKKLCYVDCYSWRTNPIKDFEEKWPIIRVSRDLSSMGIAIQKASDWLTGSPVKRAYLELLSPFLKHFEFNPVYDFIQVLNARLKESGYTSLYSLELGMHDTEIISSIQEVFDGIINVNVTTGGTAIQRTLVILHMKDTALRPQYYPINVTSEGVRIETKTSK